jgi:hypothetical protein
VNVPLLVADIWVEFDIFSLSDITSAMDYLSMDYKHVPAEHCLTENEWIQNQNGISEEIESDSGEIRDIARELNSDIADIGAASQGLAEIFGVKAEGD